jgi:hypothetical protein
MISERMQTRAVALDKPLPIGLDALWIVEPSAPFKPAELSALKDWVSAGNTLGVVAGRRRIDFGRFVSAPLDTGLIGLLSGWGLDLREGFVVDALCEKIGKPTARGGIVAPYPYMPISRRLNRDSPATRALDSVSFRYAHPLSLRAGSGSRYTSLADSSRISWYQKSAELVPGVSVDQLKTGVEGPFSLAGILEPPRGKIIVVGSQYVLDPGLPMQPSSLAFFFNLLDLSVQDSELAAIRSKGLAFRPLRPLSEGQSAAVKCALILFLPLAVLACAAAALIRRRARLASLPGLYADA